VYTLAEVQAHGTPADCWSIVSGNVYDLTNWEDKHPGGARRIVRMCGKDATADFRDEHGTGGKPNSTLATYQIGTLAD
jgi:cytochrome b involved in lipid metabolism